MTDDRAPASGDHRVRGRLQGSNRYEHESREQRELLREDAALDQPRSPARAKTLDTDCDETPHCDVTWPASPTSWCEGCLNRRLAEGTALRAQLAEAEAAREAMEAAYHAIGEEQLEEAKQAVANDYDVLYEALLDIDAVFRPEAGPDCGWVPKALPQEVRALAAQLTQARDALIQVRGRAMMESSPLWREVTRITDDALARLAPADPETTKNDD